MSRWSLRDRRWKEVAALVKERDGYRCVDCGADADLTVDHLEAVVHLIADDRIDQAYDPDYLVTRCRSCNSSKGAGTDGRPTIVHPRYAEALGLPAAGWLDPAPT